jgi:hypothetical protein
MIPRNPNLADHISSVAYKYISKWAPGVLEKRRSIQLPQKPRHVTIFSELPSEPPHHLQTVAC